MSDQTGVIVVDFRVVLAFDHTSWEDAFLDAVEAHQTERGQSVQLAHSVDTEIDLLVVVYQGTDHARIVETDALRATLAAEKRTVKRVLLVACGGTRGSGTLTEADVLKLLQDQSIPSGDPHRAVRALRSDGLTDSCREALSKEARRHRLYGLGPPAAPLLSGNDASGFEPLRDELTL